MQTGWLTLQTAGADGTLQTYQYYLNPQTGILTTGLIELQDSYYYFQPPNGQISANAAMDWGMMVTGQSLTITQDGDTAAYEFDENGKGIRLPEPVALEVSENTILGEGEEDYAN